MLENRIDNFFKLPICFANNINTIPNNIITDLELIEEDDNNTEECNSIYKILLNSDNNFSRLLMKQWIKHYTTDREYLTSTQDILQKLQGTNIKSTDITLRAWESYKSIKEDENFIDKYQYINWDYLGFLNKSILFLSVLSIYSIVSPALNLTCPAPTIVPDK